MLDGKTTVHDTDNNYLIKPPEALKYLPASAQKMYEVLAVSGAIKPITLSQKCNISIRTVRKNLKIFIEQDIVSQVPDFDDMRISYYKLKEGASSL